MTAWPRPPRRVRAATALATWGFFGVLCTAAVVLALLGGVCSWSDDGFRSPRDDWRLDAAAPRELALGTITAVDDRGTGGHAANRARYSYSFTDAQGHAHTSAAWLAPNGKGPGDHHGVEYLPDEPDTNRLVDGTATRIAAWLPWYAGSVLLPALLATGLWLARSYRTFVIVRHGRAADATLLELRLPAGRGRYGRRHCRVRYRFHGNDGQDHDAVQFARLGSPLARALQGATEGLVLRDAFAVHAENAPKYCRLVATAETGEAEA